MGQPIKVTVREVVDPLVRQFVLDRSLTGMGLLEYFTPDDAEGDRPPDSLARKLFALKGVAAVFVYSSVVSVGLAPGFAWDDVLDSAVAAIENLFVHYDVNRV